MPEELPTDPQDRLQAIQQRASVNGPSRAQDATTYRPAPRPTELLSWNSDSRVFDPKSSQWFLGLFAVGVLLVIVFAVFQEVMLILLTVATIFVLYALTRVHPVEVDHHILSTGIQSGGRLYTWSELASFWIYQRGAVFIARVDTKLHFPHMLELLLTDVAPDQVESILRRYLPQREKAVPETSPLVDQTLTSLANKLPYRDKMLGWVEKNTGYIKFDQDDPTKQA